MNNSLAQVASEPLGKIGEGKGLGPFSNITSGAGAVTAIASIISLIVGFITIVAGIFFLFQLLIGGINWIGAGGDKNRLQSAQEKFTFAFVGLIVVAAAYALTSLAGSLLGLENILLQNPAGLIDQLQGK